MKHDPFTTAYIAAALWSSTDDAGNPMDANFNASDLAPETLARIEADCRAFQEQHAALLEQAGCSDDQAGHDFWLTRNKHGAGFWDRGVEPVWRQLTEAAQGFKAVDLYVGDDGKIYLS